MNPQDRFEVGDDVTGHLASFSKRQDAFEYASLKTMISGNIVHVFDTMAHHGRPELWRVFSDGSATCLGNREGK